MTTISSYTTQSGVRYRVRYRKPDGSQTDKRGVEVPPASLLGSLRFALLEGLAGGASLFPKQIPNRWNLADSWPLPSVRWRFSQINFGVND